MKVICDWENCKEIGLYKAPVERDNSRKFRLLCLEHIKILTKIGIILRKYERPRNRIFYQIRFNMAQIY